MIAILHLVGMFIIDLFKSRSRLEAENLFLRHQLAIALRRAPPRLRLRGSDRAVPVVNSMQLATDAEWDDPLRDVGSRQNNFWDCLDLFRPRAALETEILVLRQQIVGCDAAGPVACHFWSHNQSVLNSGRMASPSAWTIEHAVEKIRTDYLASRFRALVGAGR